MCSSVDTKNKNIIHNKKIYYFMKKKNDLYTTNIMINQTNIYNIDL